MINTPEVLTILILNSIFLFFTSIAFYLSAKIFLKWDLNSTSTKQYKLEKYSYLSATIIKFVFYIKVPLFIFFIFTLDKLSNIITGAMCGAGVVDATDYGAYLIVLKVLNLYLFAYWIVLNKEDLKHESQPYTKLKFGVFMVAYILLLIEIIVELVMFNAIEPNAVVDCCGVIFSSSTGSYIGYILNLDSSIILSIFYANFLALVVLYFFKNRYLYSIVSIVFIVVSLTSLISFFGTYIYELPTHHCPFCFLQHDYNYIGYIIYLALFIGTFNGLVISLVEFSKKEQGRYFNVSILFNFIYVLIVTIYPILFYIKNGVFLE